MVQASCVLHPWWGLQALLAIVSTVFLLSFSLRSLLLTHFRDTQEADFLTGGSLEHNSRLSIWLNLVESKQKEQELEVAERKVRTRRLILQGLGVAQAARTERWLWKEEKHPKISFFFVKK